MNYKILLVIFALLCSSSASFAANKKKDSRPRLTREQLAVKQACYIASELNLDSKATQKFVDTYTRCQQEMMKLGDPKKQGSNATTEDEARKIINERFDNIDKQLQLRKKYYNEYSKFLTQLQILQLYKEEDKIQKRYRSHISRPKK